MSSTNKNANLSDRLLRSRVEIARVLEALAARREVVIAQLEGEGVPFSSRFIHADPAGQFIVITLAADESANAALLAHARATFVSAPGGWHIEFVAIEPSEVIHDGTPAIRLRYPEVLTAQQRRRNPRVDMPPKEPLQCLADAGGITPFQAQLVDVSLDGVGILLYPFDISLEPGTLLVGCCISAPGQEPVAVDLEVRYSEVIPLPEGGRARRSGCRFVGVPDEVRKLLDKLDPH